jgi:hypothetical protein
MTATLAPIETKILFLKKKIAEKSGKKLQIKIVNKN